MASYTKPVFGRAALLTIDVQNDTLDDRAFGIKGTYGIIPRIKGLLDIFREKNVL